jgi:hypothetical protein
VVPIQADSCANARNWLQRRQLDRVLNYAVEAKRLEEIGDEEPPE